MTAQVHPLIASVTIALVTLGCLATLAWQVVHGQVTDPLIAGLLGAALGVLVPSPGSTTRSEAVSGH